MNSNKCEHIMDSFYTLDKGERIPFSSTLHLIGCRKCRTQVRYLSKAEKLVKRPLREIQRFSGDSLSDVLRNTSPAWMNKIKPVSMTKWVVGGLLMIFFFGFGGKWISMTNDQTYLFWFYMMFAIAVSVYCAAFVAANMDFFIKKIDTKRLA